MTVSNGIFLATAAALLLMSWRSLRPPLRHGFYRLFGFQAINALAWLSYPAWRLPTEHPLQLLSGLLLLCSLYLVVHGLYLLVRRGGRNEQRRDPGNFAFENTARLVDEGLYGYIRHPMYASLLFLLWGFYLKAPGIVTTLLVVGGSLALFKAARVEEWENLRTFGRAYRAYIRRTRMFIPYLF